MKDSYKVINILDLERAIGEKNLERFLFEFSCPMNKEVQHFIRNHAYMFARKKISITYLIISEDDHILAAFTLAHKVIKIEDKMLSNTKRKKISRYATLDSINRRKYNRKPRSSRSGVFVLPTCMDG